MVKLNVRDRESIQEAVRRFLKLVERSGIKKEMRRREYYEKPSETRRRARLRRAPGPPHAPVWAVTSRRIVAAPSDAAMCRRTAFGCRQSNCLQNRCTRR